MVRASRRLRATDNGSQRSESLALLGMTSAGTPFSAIRYPFSNIQPSLVISESFGAIRVSARVAIEARRWTALAAER